MSDSAAPLVYETSPVHTPVRMMLHYGWVNLAIAALAMVATLPGRTFGLAMLTEPMLAELHIGHVAYGMMNLWATLIGATFALACGPLIDRFGSRAVLAGTAALLCGSVLAMGRITGAGGLAVTLTLTRGFGQSALSVVSIALVGKWFTQRTNVAMGIYAALVAIGFSIAIPLVQFGLAREGWRWVLGGIGWATLALAVIGAVFTRSKPPRRIIERPRGAMSHACVGMSSVSEEHGHADMLSSNDDPSERGQGTLHGTPRGEIGDQDGLTLRQTLRVPAFWVFSLSCAAFNLIMSGVTLFSQAILKERGLEQHLGAVMAIFMLSGLLANFVGGWLMEKWPLGRLMGASTVFLTLSLLVLVEAKTAAHAMLYGVALGASGGVVTVVFFACWPRMFGRRHLGKIQGTAQTMTVLASAAGPYLLAIGERSSGTFAPLLWVMALAVAALGVVAFMVRTPTYA